MIYQTRRAVSRLNVAVLTREGGGRCSVIRSQGFLTRFCRLESKSWRERNTARDADNPGPERPLAIPTIDSNVPNIDLRKETKKKERKKKKKKEEKKEKKKGVGISSVKRPCILFLEIATPVWVYSAKSK